MSWKLAECKGWQIRELLINSLAAIRRPVHDATKCHHRGIWPCPLRGANITATAEYIETQEYTALEAGRYSSAHYDAMIHCDRYSALLIRTTNHSGH